MHRGVRELRPSPRIAAWLAALAVALAAGCDRAPGPLVGDEVILSPITYAVWQDRLASYEPDIVVVDFWATWCTPCVERFPKIVELAERYEERGVRFVSMCMEDREDKAAVEGAQSFLVNKQATFDNFLLDEPLLEGFAHFELLGIPAVYVYDRDGKLKTRLTGDDPSRQFTEADIEAAIEALLAP
jgi:thiol-disulfide isomerase/thioredoxin